MMWTSCFHFLHFWAYDLFHIFFVYLFVCICICCCMFLTKEMVRSIIFIPSMSFMVHRFVVLFNISTRIIWRKIHVVPTFPNYWSSPYNFLFCLLIVIFWWTRYYVNMVLHDVFSVFTRAVISFGMWFGRMTIVEVLWTILSKYCF